MAYAITIAKIAIVVMTIHRIQIAGVVIGNVVAFIAVLPLLMRLYLRALQLSWGNLFRAFAPRLWPAAVSFAITFWLSMFLRPSSFMGLGLFAAVWCSCYWAASFRLSLNSSDREVITGIIYSITRS